MLITQAPPAPDRMFSDVGAAVAFCVARRAIAEPGQAGQPD